MNKKLMSLLVSVSIVVVFSLLLPGCSKKKEADGEGGTKEKVELVFTSWRTEDLERMNKINKVFMDKYPNIEVIFQPISVIEYDAQLRSGLETGTGADIIHLVSYDTGKTVYDLGHLVELNESMPHLKKFPESALKAWSTEDGVIYGVPSVGVSHGVYYNKDIFKKYDLKEPVTWDEFISTCRTLKDNGEKVFAQGGHDDWTLYEVVYSGLGANFYGGEEARLALMEGKAKLTDDNFVEAFKKVKELQQFFPKGYVSLDYVSMQQMFGTGQAAMFMGGSWELGIFEDLGGADVGWFAPPVEKRGDKLQYCFHVDAGIGVNKKTRHMDEAMEYLQWTSTEEFAQLLMNEVPGFFSYTPGSTYSFSNKLAQEMVDVIETSEITVRTVWEKMSAQSPTGNALMGQALQGMITDVYTPLEAARFVQDGLETWYEPFMK